MSIIEYIGGPITHRYLMKKSKDELAAMVMNLLNDKPPTVCGFMVVADATIPGDEIQFRNKNGDVLGRITNIGKSI